MITENLEDTIVESMQHVLELRSHEEGSHSMRSALLSVHLGKHLDLSSKDLAHIRRGMLLHDIGKIGIPDQILFKMGPLDPEEWKRMRHHPENGFSILNPFDFMEPALDIVRYHHESWDGSGYPEGLKGAQIPYLARIAALAEVWDSLTCDFPYRPAWSVSKALIYLEEQAGIKFDPEIVKVFVPIMMDKGLRLL
jgi:HD-GYP domain-containing protein (c-di-GMP phosphodiesterase class II)